jgi:hypothetical protein
MLTKKKVSLKPEKVALAENVYHELQASSEKTEYSELRDLFPNNLTIPKYPGGQRC